MVSESGYSCPGKGQLVTIIAGTFLLEAQLRLSPTAILVFVASIVNSVINATHFNCDCGKRCGKLQKINKTGRLMR
jgi:hypothetical protein